MDFIIGFPWMEWQTDKEIDSYVLIFITLKPQCLKTILNMKWEKMLNKTCKKEIDDLKPHLIYDNYFLLGLCRRFLGFSAIGGGDLCPEF